MYFDYLSSFKVLIDSLLHNTLGEALLVMMFIEGEDGNKKESDRHVSITLYRNIGRTVSRFLFYPVIYLLDLPPGKERAALLSLRTFRYT